MRMTPQDMKHALDALGLVADGDPRFGFDEVTVSGPARTADGRPVWVRAAGVPEPPLWPRGDAIGEASRTLAGAVRMPRVLNSWDWPRWDEHYEREGTARAYVFERVTAPPVSATPNLTADPGLPESWWSGLRRAHDAIAAAPWAGPGRPKRRFLVRLRRVLGPGTDAARVPWVPQHGDFHWANLLTGDVPTVVDWEGYSLAPRGLDAATLLVYSLTYPPVAARVREEYADVLGGDHGRLVQVYACVSVMTAVRAGYYTDLGPAIRDHMDGLVD